MRQFVDQDQVAAAGEHRRDAGVGQIARAEHAGGLACLSCGRDALPARRRADDRRSRGGRRRRRRRGARWPRRPRPSGPDGGSGPDSRCRRTTGASGRCARARGPRCGRSGQGSAAGAIAPARRACGVRIHRGRTCLPYTSRPMDWKHWYAAGLGHVWLPYAQMKTARPPLAVARTEGCRIVLADGRELIDGIASWWTACHGYNHPHIRQAVERQLAAMPHVMFGGLVARAGADAGAAAGRRFCRAISTGCSFRSPARSRSRSP